MRVESLLAGRTVEVPALPSAVDPVVQALRDQVRALEEQLAAVREAAARREAELRAQVAAVQHSPEVKVYPQVEVPPAQVVVEKRDPVGYQVLVTKRDKDGRIYMLELTPKDPA